MKQSDDVFAKSYLVDSGPLIAAIDRSDEHHPWAARLLPQLDGRLITWEGVVTEVAHRLCNADAALGALGAMLYRMEIAPALPFHGEAIIDLMRAFSPQMDFVDACLVSFARRNPGALVVTTDTRDFSTYRVPFLSPQGLFADR